MTGYATKKFNKEHMARAMGRGLPISLKKTVETCNFIRGKSVNEAKEVLKQVSEKKIAIPFKRFNEDMGHKKKIGPGRFPIKVSNALIKLLETAEANAQFKGLNTSNLTITHICSHKGGKSWHFGRKRRREMKRTHVEVVVEERAKKELKEQNKPVQDKKAEEKVAEKVTEKKEKKSDDGKK